ncbi:MAG: hypothetical protein ACE5HK_00125 [Candidatus Methylomirabilales bacterium]
MAVRRRAYGVLTVSIVSYLFTVPHAAEDFFYGEAAALGLSNAVLAGALAALYALQGIALVLSAHDRRRGHLLHVGVGLVWFIGAGLFHLPDVFTSDQYRTGLLSRLLVLGLMGITGMLAMVGMRAASSTR